MIRCPRIARHDRSAPIIRSPPRSPLEGRRQEVGARLSTATSRVIAWALSLDHAHCEIRPARDRLDNPGSETLIHDHRTRGILERLRDAGCRRAAGQRRWGVQPEGISTRVAISRRERTRRVLPRPIASAQCFTTQFSPCQRIPAAPRRGSTASSRTRWRR